MAAVQPPSRLSVAWDDIQRHLSIVVGMVSAVGFFFGYLSVSLFAWGLGVTPRDLGLTTQDYVTLAATWLILIAAFIGFGVVYHRLMSVLWARRTWWLKFLLALPYAVALLYVTAGLLGTERLRQSPITWIIFVVVAGLAYALVAAKLLQRRVALLLFLALMSVIVTIAGTYRFAAELTEESAHRADVPFLISIVLPVHEGIMRIDGEDECVLRVSERVYVLLGAVQVDVATRSFRPGDCA
jgi:hypothetical protein